MFALSGLKRGALLAAALLVASCSEESAPRDVALPNDPGAQVALIMDWWDGDYSNDAHLEQLQADGMPIWRADGSGEGGHIEVTSHYRPIDLPAFGENVIYVEETKHGDPTNIFRQRIYTVENDAQTGTVRVKLWYFKDKKKYVGAWRDLARLEGLTPEDMSPLPDNCDLIVSPQDGKFHMPMTEAACVFGDRYFSYQVLLGPNSFWFRDKIVRVADNEVLETAGAFTYHQLDKMM